VARPPRAKKGKKWAAEIPLLSPLVSLLLASSAGFNMTRSDKEGSSQRSSDQKVWKEEG